MPSVDKGITIKNLRKRKAWLSTKLQQRSDISGSTLSATENRRYTTQWNTYKKMMDSMSLPVETLFMPILNDMPFDVYDMRDKMLYYLEWMDEHPDYLTKARALLLKIKESGDFSKERNLQFIRYLECRLDEAEHKDPDDIIKKAFEGITATYPEFHYLKYKGQMLFMDEIELSLVIARCLSQTKHEDKAIKFLENVRSGVIKLKQDDVEKEKIFAPLLLLLVKLYIKTEQYDQVLLLCDEGILYSKTRNKSRYTAYFQLHKYQAKKQLNIAKQEDDAMLRAVYFSFIAMRRFKKAHEVMDYAQMHKVSFEHVRIFDVSCVDPLPPEPDFARGKIFEDCISIGHFIQQLRIEAGLTQQALCEGICDVATLSRIENGDVAHGYVFYLEAFMQRLGRDINKYFYTFPAPHEFDEKQLRNKINSLQNSEQYEDANILLSALEMTKGFKSRGRNDKARYPGINQQFVLKIKASHHEYRFGYNKALLLKLKKAWLCTQKVYDEKSIASMRLMYYEIVILNMIGIYYCENNQVARGLEIFKSIMSSLKRFYVDETERIQMYLSVSYNYSKYADLTKHMNDANLVELEGIELSVKHFQIAMLPRFYINHTFTCLAQGDTVKGLSLLILAHYLSILRDDVNNMQASREYALSQHNLYLD